jgi:hypothetical protein
MVVMLKANALEVFEAELARLEDRSEKLIHDDGRDQEGDKEDEISDSHRIHGTNSLSDTFKVD